MATFAPSDTHDSQSGGEVNEDYMEVEINNQPEIQGNATSNMECQSSVGIDWEKALEFRTKGNEAFKNNDFDSALDLYTQSLCHDPNNAKTLSNRSAVHLHLKEYVRAQEDANQAIRMDGSFVKSYFRLGRCHIATGNLAQAKVMFEKALTLEPNDRGTKSEVTNCEAIMSHQAKYEKAIQDSDFREAIFYIGQMIQKGVDCPLLYSLLAEVHCLSGKLEDAALMCNDSLRRFTNNPDLIYVKALIEYHRDNLDRAKTLFTIVLKSDPDHAKSHATFKKLKSLHRKKEEGNRAVKEQKYEEALLCYDEALTVDSFNRTCNAKLLCNRALCKEKLGDLIAAVDDCTGAINLDDKYVRAFLRRARLYQYSEQHDCAVADFETVMRLEPSQGNKASLSEAKRLQKVAKRKDYYKILNVNRNATDDEIKRAYRKKAVLHHPDKHASESEARQSAEEQLFKEVGEAYSVLSDQKKRGRYDRGEDIEDLACDVDPTQIFQNLFSMGGKGAPGGFTFSFGGGNQGYQSFF